MHIPDCGLGKDGANAPALVSIGVFDATRAKAPLRFLKSVTATLPRPVGVTRPRTVNVFRFFFTETVVLLAVLLRGG